MRSRERNDHQYRSYSYPVQVVGQAQRIDIVNKPSYTTADIFYDEVTPRFSKLRRDGKFIFTSAEWSKTTVYSQAILDCDFIIWSWDDSRKTWVACGGWRQNGPNTSSVFYDQSYTQGNRLMFATNPDPAMRTLFGYDRPELAVKKQAVLDRVYSRAGEPDALTLVSAAEFDKTLDMVTGLGKRCARLAARLETFPAETLRTFRRLRAPGIREVALGALRGSPTAAAKRLATLANLWLEARYGWQASYYDFCSWTSIKRRKPFRRLVSSMSDVYDPSYSERSWNFYDAGLGSGRRLLSYQETDKITRYTEVSAGVYVETNPLFTTADSAGIRNVLSTGWELVPFSFVVDWFIDVGDRIAAVEGKILTNQLGSWRVCRHRLTRARQHEGTLNPDVPVGKKVEGHLKETCLLVESTDHIIREANPAFKLLPSVNVNINRTKLVDSAALLTQQAKRLLRSLRG